MISTCVVYIMPEKIYLHDAKQHTLLAHYHDIHILKTEYISMNEPDLPF